MCTHPPATFDASPTTRHAQEATPTAMDLRALVPGWTLDQHQDTDGTPMLILTPPGAEDTTPTFVLTHTPHGIEIALAIGDSCDTVSTRSTTKEAIQEARRLHRAALLAAMPQPAQPLVPPAR